MGGGDESMGYEYGLLVHVLQLNCGAECGDDHQSMGHGGCYHAVWLQGKVVMGRLNKTQLIDYK